MEDYFDKILEGTNYMDEPGDIEEIVEEHKAPKRKTKVKQEGSPYPPGARHCPKCMVPAVVVKDGCSTCLNCGDSKCG